MAGAEGASGLVEFDEEQAELARTLAGEMRGVVQALATQAPSADALRDALAATRELRRTLEAPRRPSWYEAGDPTRRLFFDKSPVSGEINAVAPTIRSAEFEVDGKRGIELETIMPRHYEGPPHGVHGGWVAALFDEVLGSAQKFAGTPGVTAILEVRYRRITPVDVPLRFRAWVEESEGRRIVARATCEARGELTADAKAIFMRVDFEAIEARGRTQES